MSIIQAVLIQGTGPFDFGNYWKLHEHIERMRAWVQLQLCYFKVAWYITLKKSVVVILETMLFVNRSWHNPYIPLV
jgi:hypothetical protein